MNTGVYYRCFASESTRCLLGENCGYITPPLPPTLPVCVCLCVPSRLCCFQPLRTTAELQRASVFGGVGVRRGLWARLTCRGVASDTFSDKGLNLNMIRVRQRRVQRIVVSSLSVGLFLFSLFSLWLPCTDLLFLVLCLYICLL